MQYLPGKFGGKWWKKMRALHWFERQKKRRRCQNGKMAGKNEEKMPMAKLPAKYF